jgi:hypothetical protein
MFEFKDDNLVFLSIFPAIEAFFCHCYQPISMKETLLDKQSPPNTQYFVSFVHYSSFPLFLTHFPLGVSFRV